MLKLKTGSLKTEENVRQEQQEVKLVEVGE